MPCSRTEVVVISADPSSRCLPRQSTHRLLEDDRSRASGFLAITRLRVRRPFFSSPGSVVEPEGHFRTTAIRAGAGGLTVSWQPNLRDAVRPRVRIREDTGYICRACWRLPCLARSRLGQGCWLYWRRARWTPGIHVEHRPATAQMTLGPTGTATLPFCGNAVQSSSSLEQPRSLGLPFR